MDDPEYLLKELQDARDLAQQLWTQCRQSGSSYRLLCGSLRNLRNVLEELEELELRPNDVNLEAQVDESHDLLERINISYGIQLSLQSNEVDESLVADFKTSLDVLSQHLNATHDSISTGEIPLKLDPAVIPGLASPSSRWGSTSASAVDSGHEPRPSTRTSSAYSSIAQDNPWRQDDKDAMSPSRDQAEKEVHDTGSNHLQPASESTITTATTPSLDWRAPFAFPDPMSTSIEQASTMILRDEDNVTLSGTQTRPVMISHSSSQYSTDAPADQPESEAEVGTDLLLGQDKLEETLQQRQKNPLLSDRPRALSEVILTWSRADTSIETVSKLHAAKSSESMEQLPPRRLYTPRKDATTHLSPTAVAQEFGRRNTISSGASTSFSPRSIDVGEYPTSSNENFRKDLSIVFENALSETDETAPSDLQAADHSVALAEENVVPPLPSQPPPPPPSRKPPSPPKERQIPKVPKRSATYRVVNRAKSEESSSESEDERPLSSMNSLSTMRTKSSVQDEEKEAANAHGGELGTGENDRAISESRSERRPSRDRIPHSQRVLMARAAYTQPATSNTSAPTRSQTSAKPAAFAPKLSTHSLHIRRYSEEASPTLKRHFTSAESPRDRPVTAGHGVASPKDDSETFGRSLSTSRSLSQIGNIRNATSTVPFDRSSSSLEDTSSVFEKETAPETGPEVLHPFHHHIERSYSSEAPDVVRDTSHHSESPVDATSSHADLDTEHINHIVHFWNRCAWDQAESYLTGYLEHLLERNSLDRARRVRHLLGVCASFGGQWEKALSFFLAVLRTPIRNISDLDDGDCAAAYWLGDTYALLNRRTEAVLAYRIAERSSLFVNAKEASLCDCINAEQAAVQLDTSLAAIKSLWAQQSLNMVASDPQSILDLRMVSETAANRLFDEPRRIIGHMKAHPSDTPLPLDPNKSRTHAFYPASRFSALSNYHRLTIAAAEFEPTKPWPMPYDPFLSMANVRLGRLLLHESDLLAVLNSNATVKVPKAGPMNLSKMESFATGDLSWLIRTLRECLTVLNMGWSEVSNVKGSWFAVRHSFMQGHFATTHYFAISILKHSLRSGYGVEICPDGICAARIIRSDLEYQKGVHIAETKRVKKLIREYLDTTAKQRLKTK